jgi:hypothetical protein
VNTTTTLNTASAQAKMSFALKPPGTPPPATVTEGGIYVATGAKATAGAVSATTATLTTAAVQARLTFALKPPAAPPVNTAPVVEGIPQIQGAVEAPVVFPVVYFDAEGDTVTFSLVAGTSEVPTGAVVTEDESSGNWSFEWTPSSTQTGEWFFTLRATDGTNTVDTPIAVTVVADPDTTLLALAQAIAARAQADVEAAQALADLIDQREQMNAKVIHDVRTLVSDLQASKDYMEGVIAQLEEEAEQD